MNKRKTKKAAKKVAARKAPSISKPFATARELVRFRQNVAKANKRIARLEQEGLEPSVLSFVKSALGDRIHIPRGKALTEQAYNKIKAITERFLNTKSSKLKTAREGERKHREAFAEQVRRALGSDTKQDIIDRLYYALGDVDMKSLLDNYVYGEIISAAEQLDNVGIEIQKNLIEDVIEHNISYVIENELNALGIPTDGTTLRDYVDIALQYGFNEAVRQYREDETEE